MAATSAHQGHTMRMFAVLLVVMSAEILFYHSETYNKSISSTVSSWASRQGVQGAEEVIRCFEDKDEASDTKYVSEQDKMAIEESLVWLNSLNASYKFVERTRATQIARMSHIKQTCDLVPRFYERFGGSTSIIDFGNATFWLIPKTGTTNLLRKLCIMIGPSCGDVIGDENEHTFMIYSKRSFASKVNKTQLLVYAGSSSDSSPLNNTSVKPRKFLFTIVRDPWKRLVSTYIQKFLFSNQYMVQCGVVKGEWAEFNKLILESNSTWSFRDFIEKCVIKQYDKRGMSGMNEHWRPQFVEGAFCDINHNFIAKLETFKQDELAIIKQFSPTTDSEKLDEEAFKYRRANEKSGLTSKSYTEYWRTINPASMDRLIQIYKVDVLMFGYDLDPLMKKS